MNQISFIKSIKNIKSDISFVYAGRELGNMGKECIDQCEKPGKCEEYCGAGMACCRKRYKNSLCNGFIGGISRYECDHIPKGI